MEGYIDRIKKYVYDGGQLKDLQLDITHIHPSFVSFHSKKYNRITLYSDDIMEIVAICWLEGQSSGFHGHPGECVYKILQGEMIEEYEAKGQRRILQSGQQGYIDNSIDTHNMIAMKDTISFHVYSPPFLVKKL